jgi:hypothetical protein
MQILARKTALLAVLIGATLFGCGGDGGGGGTGPVDNYLPLVSNFWKNVAAPAHTLTLQSSNDLKATGSFTGTEAHPTFGSSQTSGSWTNSTFTMSIARSGGAVTYTGKFVSRDTLRLTRTGETLTFWHN